MHNLKIIFLIVFNCICFGHCWHADEVVQPDPDVVQDVMLAAEEVKINWGPVWDDNDANNEFVYRTASAADGEADSDHDCRAPNGLGLENLLREVGKILPKKQIDDILKNYAEDPEIKALKAFMESPQTQENIKAIHSAREYQILKDYICHVLHIDMNKYHKLVRILIQPELPRAAADTQTKKGIRGLINELNAIMPWQQLRYLYKQLLVSDEELAKAVESLESEEFQQLLSNVKDNVAAYQQLRREALIALGLPIEQMQQLLGNNLDWGVGVWPVLPVA